MKKITLAVVAAMFFCASAFAQQDSGRKKMNNASKDNLVWKNGKAYTQKNGVETPITEDFTLGNGTIITVDGTVKTKSGKSRKLANGETVNSSGQITPTSANPTMPLTPPPPADQPLNTPTKTTPINADPVPGAPVPVAPVPATPVTPPAK